MSGTLGELATVDFGGPLHSMVLLGRVGADEEELLRAFCTPAAEVRARTALAPRRRGSAAAHASPAV